MHFARLELPQLRSSDVASSADCSSAPTSEVSLLSSTDHTACVTIGVKKTGPLAYRHVVILWQCGLMRAGKSLNDEE
jgi:hypothetical protein